MATDAMADADWSALPSDIVNRVAGCFLDTNDLDYYSDFRAVCRTWSGATADPRTSPDDPRFRMRRWVVLDERESSNGDAGNTRLFVNSATGRLVRIRLPLLRSHHFVTSTVGGYLVLAEQNPPHAARVLNPFTGALTRFTAPVPREARLAADVAGSSFTLVLASLLTKEVYWADLRSESFSSETYDRHPASRLPIIARKCVGSTQEQLDLSFADAEFAYKHFYRHYRRFRYFVLESAASFGGEMLVVLMLRRRMAVLPVPSSGREIGPVKSIGSYSLFLGDRCVAVDADRFPSIEANSLYYQRVCTDDSGKQCSHIYVYDLGKEEEDTDVVLDGIMGPCTIVQLLSRYTMSVPRSRVPYATFIPETFDAYDRAQSEHEFFVNNLMSALF